MPFIGVKYIGRGSDLEGTITSAVLQGESLKKSTREYQVGSFIMCIWSSEECSGVVI